MLMDQLAGFARFTLKSYVAWAVVFLVLTLIERVFAKEETTWLSRARGLLFWMIFIPGTQLISMALWGFWKALGIQPLLYIDVVNALGWAGPFAVGGGIVLGILIGDFTGYWFHRLQHKYLWRFHAVHHSITEMNAVNCYHHISEAFFNTLVVTIPVSLVTVSYGPTLWIVGVLIWFQVVFLHSPTTLHFGPFRHVVADNRFHRIHHSIEQRHFDKNFAITFAFWDHLFGTAHTPARGEWPDVGIAEVGQPQTIREWLDLPARYRAVTIKEK